MEALSEQSKPAQESTPTPRMSRDEMIKLARQRDPNVKLAWEQTDAVAS